MIAKTHDKLKKFLGKKQNIRITLNIDGEEEAYDGNVVGLSRTLVVFLEFNDFAYDGCIIFRIRDIVKIRRSKFETTYDRILKFHSLDREPVPPSWLKYGSWPSVCKSLMTQGKCVSLQTFGKREWFSVGLIQEVRKDHISIREFDATAKWEEEPLLVGFKEIRYINFDSNYVNTFYEYMKSLK